MKKLFKSITACLLATTCVFGAACGSKNNGTSTGDGGGDNTTYTERERYTYEGVHNMSAPEIEGEWLVKDGATDFVLVTPASSDSNINTAADEFRTFFKKATDIDIQTIRDDDVENPAISNDNAKRISLGLTTFVTDMTAEEQEAILGYNAEELGRDGVRIAKHKNTVYLLGGKSEGVINAVYDFLQICFNYEFYYRNCIEIDTSVRNLKMRNFDVTDIPDTSMRSYGNPVALSTKMFDYEVESGEVTQTDVTRAITRYRVYNCNKYYLPIFRNWDSRTGDYLTYGYHSSDYFLNESSTAGPFHKEITEEYPEGENTIIWDPKWRGDDGIQLCYTAHGDDVSLEKMINACAEKIIYSLTCDDGAYADREYVGLTIMDGGTNCTCSSCTELYNKDGQSYAGANIRFCNRVMEIVKEWSAEHEGIGKNLKLYFFAYGATEAPPVVENSKGEFVAANDEVICRDDLITLLCTSNYATSIYWPQSTLQTRLDNISQWGIVTKNIFNWFYQMRYLGYAGYHDSITMLNSDFYAYALNYGSLYMMNQGDWEGDSITSYGVLNEYVFSKLMWNSSLKMEDLVKKFFKAMYKDASDTMYEIFQMTREHSLYVEQQGGSITAGTNLVKQKFYSYGGFLKPVLDLYDVAYADIEGLKTTSPSDYILVKNRINNELVSPLYLALALYGSNTVRPFDNDTKLAYKQKLMEITDGIYYKISELGGNVNDFANSL